MKKLYSLLAATILAAGGPALMHADVETETVYSQGAYSEASKWTAFAGAGNSGNNFTSSSSFVPSGGYYSYTVWNTTGTVEKDLWLSSPAIELSSEKNYTIDLQYQTWSPFQVSQFDIYISDSAVSSQEIADNVASLTPVYSATDMTGNKNEWLPLTVEGVTGNGTSYVVFHVSGTCSGRFSIGGMKVYSVAPAVPKALAPTELTATAATDGSLAVNLTWTLPVENDAAEALEGDAAITAVCVYRDGEKVTELEGAATAYTDTEATGLTAGAHSYTVCAVSNGAEGAMSESAIVEWVGPWSYSEKTMTVDNNSPSTAWTYSQSSTNANIRVMTLTPGEGFTNSVQLWAYSMIDPYSARISSPQLNIIPGRSYKISFYYRFNPNSETEVGGLAAYLSPVRAAESSEAAAISREGVKLLDVSAYAGSVNSNTPWQKVEYKGYKATTSPVYLNFHVSGPVCKGIYISGLTIEEFAEQPFAPEAPTNLTAKAAENQQLEVALSWVNPTKSINGDKFTADQTIQEVYIYRDEYETPVATVEGDATTFTDSAEFGLTPGAHTYKVKVVVADEVSDFSNEASVTYVGSASTQQLPWNPTVAGLSTDEFNAMWLSYSPLTYGSNWTNRPVGILLMNSTGVSADNWLISAPLAIEAGYKYDVNYTINSTTASVDPTVEIGFVDSTTPDEFIVSENAVIGSESQCTLEISNIAPFSLEAEEESAPEYRLAIRDITSNPEAGYNLILTSIHVSKGTPTGVETVIAQDEIIEIFNISGHRVNSTPAELNAGIYIVKLSDGKVIKIIK